jgi:hypothetical protein
LEALFVEEGTFTMAECMFCQIQLGAEAPANLLIRDPTPRELALFAQHTKERLRQQLKEATLEATEAK